MVTKLLKRVPKRGEIYWINFDPTVGHEIKKTRPALILQNNLSNTHSHVVIVAAISGYDASDTVYPNEVILLKQKGLNKNSIILLSQLRTVDKKRLIKFAGKINQDTQRLVDNALKISLGLVDFD